MSSALINNKYISILIISTLTWLVYFSSINVPFYLDDFIAIKDNSIINNGSFLDIFNSNRMRSIGNFTFAFDYKISGDIKQFHITNTLIHLINGLLIFSLIKLLIKNSLVQIEIPTSYINYIPLVIAIIFIVHPLNTQAVTYIVQRFASLVTLFYLLSLCSYLILRTTNNIKIQIVSLIVFIFAVSAALLTKQNSASLPLMIVLVEVTFLNRIHLKYLAIIVLILSITLFLGYLFSPEVVKDYISIIDVNTRENQLISRVDYLLAQVNILWIYIGKFFFPYALRLEYGFEIDSFGYWQTIGATLAHSLILLVAIVWRKKLPLICFGILFYYVAHIIESSIIPIKDLAFEHRAYLPNIGLIISTVAALSMFFGKIKKTSINIQHSFFIILIVLLSLISIKRNLLWQKPIDFYLNELSYLPNSCRLLNNLASEYYKIGTDEKAHPLIEKCVTESNGKLTNYEFVSNYIAMLIRVENYEKADSVGIQALKTSNMKPIPKRQILENMGILKMKQNNLPMAEKYFKQAIVLPEPQAKTYFALSVTLAKQGKLVEAREFVLVGLQKAPQNEQGKKILEKIDKFLP